MGKSLRIGAAAFKRESFHFDMVRSPTVLGRSQTRHDGVPQESVDSCGQLYHSYQTVLSSAWASYALKDEQLTTLSPRPNDPIYSVRSDAHQWVRKIMR